MKFNNNLICEVPGGNVHGSRVPQPLLVEHILALPRP